MNGYLATAAACLIRPIEPTAPTFIVVPSMIILSNLTSPFSSGLPPNPTVVSHWSISHCVQPASNHNK